MFENLKKIREENELSQRSMAKKLNISKSSYNYFETGEHIIPLKHLNNFCNIFNVTMDYLCGLTTINIKPQKVYELNRELICERLRKVRLKNNLKQYELAKILNTSQSNISSYENNRSLILTAFVYNFAKHFNVSLDYLTGRSDNIKIITKR